MQDKVQEEEKGREGSGGDDREFVIRIRLPKLPMLVPEETHRHVAAAQKEMLLAFRSMIDACIEKMEEKSKPEPKGPTKIEVE